MSMETENDLDAQRARLHGFRSQFNAARIAIDQLAKREDAAHEAADLLFGAVGAPLVAALLNAKYYHPLARLEGGLTVADIEGEFHAAVEAIGRAVLERFDERIAELRRKSAAANGGE